jgi:hypothetical protein
LFLVSLASSVERSETRAGRVPERAVNFDEVKEARSCFAWQPWQMSFSGTIDKKLEKEAFGRHMAKELIIALGFRESCARVGMTYWGKLSGR